MKKQGKEPPTLGQGLPTSGSVVGRFLQPIHADRAGLIYTRTYSELKGVTDAMENQMSQVLSQGIIDGKGPLQIAREMNNRIEQAGGNLAIVDEAGTGLRAIDRARMIARTEVIRAHHVANINTYREAGLEGVSVQAEWSTAGDDRVCEKCAELQGLIYSLDMIEGMIPLHPQCRCVALPYLDGTAQLDEIEPGIWKMPTGGIFKKILKAATEK